MYQQGSVFKLWRFGRSVTKVGICFLAFLLGQTVPAPSKHSWEVPLVERKLANGLTVIVSEDHTSPTFGLCISYGIGYRLEPEGRSGFAHLFEHFMFQGTPNAPKGIFSSVIDEGGAAT